MSAKKKSGRKAKQAKSKASNSSLQIDEEIKKDTIVLKNAPA